MRKIKIAYIGGGSKMWARIFMNDLALSKKISGDIYLYDIDTLAAKRNQIIGSYINELENTTKWNYEVVTDIKDALTGADFVILSILPGTLNEMQSDVHLPEKYGIYQTVGDTVGPGGVIRAMRTVPLYEEFAKKIKEYAPNAWVINLTNPMSICVKTLYDVFPGIKAIGCCHEVFHAQDFLAQVVKEKLNLDFLPTRQEIKIDVSGINHFTWIKSAKYKEIEILPWIHDFYQNHFEEGFYEYGDPFQFKYNTFAYGNKVKMDLYKKYNVLAAAGDRHLVEFVNNNWYLKDLETIKNWAISITPVSFRISDMNEKINESIKLCNKEKKVEVTPSTEEAVEIMEALLGLGDLTTNVNFPNKGQVTYLPLNDIVESNCKFSFDHVELIKATDLGVEVDSLILTNCLNIDLTYEGIKNRNFNTIFNAFMNQPLCSNLTIEDGKKLFKEMVLNTTEYLKDYFDIESFKENF